jgi:FkbM family methyltransferase
MYDAAGTLRASALELEPMVSYSGNQEDVRLRRIEQLLPNRRYVDVGAGDPVDGSVTYWLYTQGWRGVLVEPGTRGSRLLEVRPEDEVVQAAVGGGSGQAVLYETSPDAGMSTMRVDRLSEVLAFGQTVRETRMPVLSLTDVFARAGGPVSVLSVDVEGAEGEVLGSLDWEAHRPVVVVVEAILPWQAVSTRADFEHHLREADYPEIAFDGVNTYYVDRRHEQFDELAAALAYPVSLLDRWESHGAVLARERAAAAEGDLHGVRRELAAVTVERDRLAEALAQAQADLAATRAELAHATTDLEEQRRAGKRLAVRVAAEQDRREDVELLLGRAEAELDVRGRRVAELSRQVDEILASTVWRLGAPVAHAVARGTRPLRGLAAPAVTARNLRSRVSEGAEQVRLRRAGPAGRAAAAVLRHSHPAFLAGPATATAPDVDWSVQAAAVQADDDDALRERLERRDGVRSAQEREVLLAALAVAVDARGHKSRGHRSTERRDVVLDARSLQDPGLALRGVGQYARELARSLRATGSTVLLLVDPELGPLDGELADLAQVDEITPQRATTVRWLVQPSPMTASQAPLLPLLDDDQVHCTAVVHDLIPAAYPDVYLSGESGRLRQAAREQALRLYDELLLNSHATLAEVTRVLGRPPRTGTVAWPSLEQHTAGALTPPMPPLPERYLLLAGGYEHRKNVVAGLGAAALLQRQGPLHVVVMGWSGPVELVRSLASDAGLDADLLHVLPYVDDEQAATVRGQATVTVVPSFAEGLSLPVIEGVRAGSPVVASAIPPHLELLGAGPWLADPASPEHLARAVRAVVADRAEVLGRQARSVGAHEHLSVEEAVGATHRRLEAADRSAPATRAPRAEGRPRIGVVTPWPPQRSGIADFSRATLAPLATSVDLVLHTSRSARHEGAPGATFAPASVADPALASHDALLTVIGNSHFHLPGIEVVEARGGVALCHDVRQTELNSYLGLQDALSGGQRRPAPPRQTRTLRHELDAVPTLGFGHLARHCSKLLFHSAVAADRVAVETGVPTAALPFVPYRQPKDGELGGAAREAARAALHLTGDAVHLGLLGGVDIRTKAADVIVEAHAWLRQWDHPVVLHVVGGVDPVLQVHLEQLVEQAGTAASVLWHGHVGAADYRRWLIAVDLGVQLRTAALLTLSGAVADLAAFGVPSVASAAMADDMGLPAFVRRVPDDFSPLIVAEALEAALADGASGVEEQRRAYLRSHSVQAYDAQLLAHLEVEAP